MLDEVPDEDEAEEMRMTDDGAPQNEDKPDDPGDDLPEGFTPLEH